MAGAEGSLGCHFARAPRDVRLRLFVTEDQHLAEADMAIGFVQADFNVKAQVEAAGATAHCRQTMRRGAPSKWVGEQCGTGASARPPVLGGKVPAATAPRSRRSWPQRKASRLAGRF